ncbi:YdhK family protein [Planococcus shenhongbingii]|uniref:YdhK family protein n=1 Tax=Planococcus shenhongbingii TaxID=3058398 RepID=A0ABT8N7K4_9BACL|nr:YdhK family protein [Planococcus sp. N017]MDN7243865.1 YdhK family protein [Planococcus sp. N017]
MPKNKWVMGMLSLVAAFTLSACNTGSETSEAPVDNAAEENMSQESGHENMDHSSSGEVPADLQEAENPAYPVGSQAIIETGHMDGMKGAEATIAGAYDTTAYAVTYTPTTGGEPVENHKWVIHEELENSGDQPLKPGDEVTLAADHMEGMDGATATIDSTENTTVYMIDFTPTTGGEPVINHKWVTESELSPKQ